MALHFLPTMPLLLVHCLMSLALGFRNSKGINVSLPTLGDVKDALTMARSWLKDSEPFLDHANAGAYQMLKVDSLKVLLSCQYLFNLLNFGQFETCST